jgi:uncharacterized membrane-anchored protein
MTHLFHLPENHPQRFKLHGEAHARQAMELPIPVRASHFALTLEGEQKAQDHVHLCLLCERYNVSAPKKDADHFSADFGVFQLRWQQHGEFSTYTFYQSGISGGPFDKPALRAVPVDWMSGLVGQLMAAAHAAIIPAPEGDLPRSEIDAYFSGNALIGAAMTGGAAQVFTDFRIHKDGFGRFLIFDRGLESRQAGRLLQRLFEIEVYRIMSLLAFPMARTLIPKLNRADRSLLKITAEMSQPDCDDAELLEELTGLATEVENCFSLTHFRFGAADAYYKLVERRITALREQRIQGIQTFGEFIQVRLEPALHTCQTSANRLSALSERIAHAGQLLRTRVDISLERQNQKLLASMNHRAQLQLRLQETVEGLSVVAISYYAVSLIGYLAKSLKAFGLSLNGDKVMGFAIPAVILAVAVGVRQIRKTVSKVYADGID